MKGEMDEIDKLIVSKLREDGRITLSSLGKIVGLSHVSVRARLRNLLKKGLIEISAGLNLEVLGIKTAVVFVETESFERLGELAKTFKDCPRLVFMSTLMGAHNLVAVVTAEDPATLESMVIGACSLRSQRGIRRSDVHIGESLVYPSHLPIRLVVNRETEVAPCRIRCDQCERYRNDKCLACPATRFYRGPL